MMKIKKGVKAVGVLIGLYIMLQVGLYFLMLFYKDTLLNLFSFLNTWRGSVKLGFLILLQSFVFLFLLWIVFEWRKRRAHLEKSIRTYFRKRWQWKGWGLVGKYVLGGLGIYFLINIVLGRLVHYYHIDIPGLYGEQMAIALLQGISLEMRGDKVLVFLLVAFFAPAVEEIIWRGFVTDRLMKSRQGEGVFLAALLFALAHMERGVVWNLVILSFILGYIYRKTGSLRYSFLFHVLINGMAMGAMMYG